MDKTFKKYNNPISVTSNKDVPEKEIQPIKDYISIRRIVLNQDKQKEK